MKRHTDDEQQTMKKWLATQRKRVKTHKNKLNNEQLTKLSEFGIIIRKR